MARTSLPPGFRFHPTDEELIEFYLNRKVHGQTIELDFIPEVDIYKCEPWDLPEKSFLPGRDLEWYFFSPRDRKYPNGLRTNRATLAGYWKATGKDRKITCRKSIVGMKKTLVFYTGRAPHGCRTGWVMHEYRLLENQCKCPSCLQDAYAVCRVSKKNGPGLSSAQQHVVEIDSPISLGNSCNDSINMVSGTMKELSPVTQESDCQTTSTVISSENFSGVIHDTNAEYPTVNHRWSHFHGCDYQSCDNSTSHALAETSLNSQEFKPGSSLSVLGVEDFATGLTLSESRMLTGYFLHVNSSNDDPDKDAQPTEKTNYEIDQFINHDYAHILAADYLELEDLVSGKSFERTQNVPPANGQEDREVFALNYDSLDDGFFDGLNNLDEESVFFNRLIRKNSDPQDIKQLMDFSFGQYLKGMNGTTDGHEIKLHVSHCSASPLHCVTIEKPPENIHSVKLLHSYCDDMETTQSYSNESFEIHKENVQAKTVLSQKGLATTKPRLSSDKHKQKERSRKTAYKPFGAVSRFERLISWCKAKALGYLASSTSKSPTICSGVGGLVVSAVRVAVPDLIYGNNNRECDINKHIKVL